MSQPFVLLAQLGGELSPSILRFDLLKIGVAIILISFAAVAATLFLSRSKSRELTLIYFGLFSFLYGVRMLCGLKTVQLSFPFAPSSGRYVAWLITCVIILPFELFLYDIADSRMKTFFQWLIAVQTGLSAALILFTGLGFNSAKLSFVNSMSVLATLLVAPAFYALARLRDSSRQPLTREVRIFIAGFAIWLLFVLQENLRTVGVLKNWHIEFLGLFVFVCCLGYIAVSRSFAKEQLLLTINKELDIAREIQASTLPREVPQVSGLQIAARYVPMSAVAGDFYDFLIVDDQRLGILVADVTGHGVPAALIASMLKVAFAGQSENAADPARLLSGLNRSLCGKFQDHFVTAIYVFVDLRERVLRYAGAGHPPLLFLSPMNGGVRPVEENGLMLGLFPEASYNCAEICLRAGDRCLLYTDGLFEAMNPSQEEFGKERLVQFLQQHASLSAPHLAAELLAEISRWSAYSTGRRQEDDITLLVLDFPNHQQAVR